MCIDSLAYIKELGVKELGIMQIILSSRSHCMQPA